jgi:hypothetical protein
VRKLARLALFFSIGFAILFAAMSGMRFLALRLDWAGPLSGRPGAPQADLLAAARWALSLAVYGGILLGLACAVLEKVFAPAAIFCVCALSLGFALGIGHGLESWPSAGGAGRAAPELGGPGVILSGPAGRGGMALVLLQGPGEPARSRVLAVPGSPMVFQEEFAGLDRALVSLPPAPFSVEAPWFVQSVASDARASADNLMALRAQGILPFLAYAGPLAFLLCSLMFVLKISAWPLANFFLGVLAFRGVLALEVFFASGEMQGVFASFLQGRLPVSLAVPAIFLAAGSLACLYSLLAHFAGRQARNARS